MSIKLIVGLGNYDEKYENTRHNLGIWYINLLTTHYKLNLIKKEKFYGFIGKIKINNNIVYVLIPTTYMNFSGISVAAVSNFYKFFPEDILIVHDDLDLLPGNLRIKFGGGHAGHNGVKNIITQLNHNQFYRLRIGIGRPKHKEEIINFVLSKLPYCEQQIIYNILSKAIFCTKYIIEKNFNKVINILYS